MTCIFLGVWSSKSGLCIWTWTCDMCLAPQRRVVLLYLIFQKRSEPEVSCAFWCGHALRAGSAFFGVWSSKSAQTPMFQHFELEMCFGPQRCAIFWHRNFQQWEHGVFCAFWLVNVLRATTACIQKWSENGAPDPQTIGNMQCFATFLTFRAPVSSFFWLFPFLSSSLLSSILLSSTLLSSSPLFSLTLPMSAFHLSILMEVWLENFLRIWWDWVLSAA